MVFLNLISMDTEEKKKSFQIEMGFLKKLEDFSSTDDYTVSSSSSLSSEMADDDDDSSSTSSPPIISRPLFELTDLMAQLPIKKGLSKFYHGKSQTFGNLSSVRRLEDLGKKETSYNQRMKTCKSFGCHYKFSPKPIITKKSSKPLFSSMSSSYNTHPF